MTIRKTSSTTLAAQRRRQKAIAPATRAPSSAPSSRKQKPTSAQINLAQASADRFSLSFSSVRDLEQPVRLTRSSRLFILSNILFFNWAHNPTPSRTPVQPDPHIVTPACSTAQAVVALLFGPACHQLLLEHAELGLRLLKFAHPGPASPSTQHRPPRVPAPRAPCCHAAAILLVTRHEGRCPSSQPGQPCPCPAPRA